MKFFNLGIAAPLLVGLIGSSAPVASQSAPPLDVDQVIAWAAPTERDLAHRAVDWLPAVVDGVVAGQTQDKPIVLWLYFGGPLGDC